MVFQADGCFERFLKVLKRESIPDRVPFVELYHDLEIMEAIMGEKFPLNLSTYEAQEAFWRMRVKFWHQLGYDYLTVYAGIPFQRKVRRGQDTAPLPHPERVWQEEQDGMITSWDDFERYRWVDPKDVDYSGFEITAKFLPDNMKIIGTTAGVFEFSSWIMGLVPMSYGLSDQPDLVKAVVDKVGSLLVEVYKTMAEMDFVGALWLGDDMGYKHGTLISPRHLRELVFPWQKKLADISHEYGKPFMLHACGNLKDIMDDLIDYVGIDAKHSFEDAFLPVTEAKRLYGNRIAILGGVDVNVLAMASEEELRNYVRRILDECAPDGGYALGSGNSVTNYVKVENFLAMLDEGRKWSYS